MIGRKPVCDSEMDTRLIGLWDSEYARPGGHHDHILIFRADGTGRYEFDNVVLNFVELFTWKVTAPGSLSITGYKRLELDEPGTGIDETDSYFELINVPYTIRQEEARKGGFMNTLKLQMGDSYLLPDHYWHIRTDLTGVEEPEFTFSRGNAGDVVTNGSLIRTYLHIGGLVAVGFDASGAYLLTITHSGRGVFSTRTWERVARDTEPAYPEAGFAVGIGPIDGQAIPVTEMDFDIGEMRVVSPDGRIVLECESSGIAVTVSEA